MTINRSKKNKVLVFALALATLPVSVPYFVVKTLRRKHRKARAQRKIQAMDGLSAKPLSDENGDYPLLSVVMPVYNIEAYLEASILSVLNQTYSNLELIVVNDASTDDSLSIARMFQKIDARVRVIDLPFNTPGGAGVPSNIGVENAAGDFVAFVDGDDFLNVGALKKLMTAAAMHNCDLTIGSFKTFEDDTKEISEPYDFSSFSQMPTNIVLDPSAYPVGLQISAVPWRKIYKRSFLQEQNVRFPEGDLFFEDNPFHWDAMTAAKSMVVVPATVSYHRMNRDGQTKSSSAPKLAAYFCHFASISRSIRKNSAEFAWAPFIKFVERTEWIVDQQLDPLLKDQFKLRFVQTIDEQIAPFLPDAAKREMNRARGRLQGKLSPADLSVVLFHDPKQASAEDLNFSIMSVRELRSIEAEIILLHNGVAPTQKPEWGDVIFAPATANRYRSFNQGLQLCSGDYIAFLCGGDQFVRGEVEGALIADEQQPDLLLTSDAKGSTDIKSDINFYSRRLIQDNGLFWGSTGHGWFSFDLFCKIEASTTRSLPKKAISRVERSDYEEVAPAIVNEIGRVTRWLSNIDLDESQIAFILRSVTAFCNAFERRSTKENWPAVKRAREQLADQLKLRQ